MNDVTTADHRPRPRRDERGGFTLIELMIVVVILGIVSGYAAIAYRGTTQRQKLATTVREFVGTYRELRAFAAKERRECYLEYDIANGKWRWIVYPYQNEMGNWTNIEGERVDSDRVEGLPDHKAWKRLDKNVFIKDIEAPGPNGNEIFDEDYWIRFRADGTVPPHIIHFQTSDGLEMSLEIEELTGKVTVVEGYVEFYAPQEEEFNNLAGGGESR